MRLSSICRLAPGVNLAGCRSTIIHEEDHSKYAGHNLLGSGNVFDRIHMDDLGAVGILEIR